MTWGTTRRSWDIIDGASPKRPLERHSGSVLLLQNKIKPAMALPPRGATSVGPFPCSASCGLGFFLSFPGEGFGLFVTSSTVASRFSLGGARSVALLRSWGSCLGDASIEKARFPSFRCVGEG